MKKKLYRKFPAFIILMAVFPTLSQGFAQDTPDTTTIFFADFDTNSDGFIFKEDLFRGTNQPDYAEGIRVSNGFNGDALRVRLGGVDTASIQNISGGWEREFVLENTMFVSITFYYNLTLEQYYEVEEFSQVLLDVNGSLYGVDGNDYIDQLFGKEGDNPPKPATGWLPVTVDIGILAPGETHRVRIGGFNNQKTNPNEFTEIFIDEVNLKGVVLPGNVPQAPQLALPNNNAIFNSLALPVDMSWSVPAEADDDSLHFSVEVDSSKGFESSLKKIYDSRTAPGFSPIPPVQQGSGTMNFQLPNDLADDVYFWRVRAFDGENFGNYSEVRRFRIDTTPPFIDSLTVGNPEPAYENQSGGKFYNQTATDSIDLAVYYNELNVRTLTYDLGVFGEQTPVVASGIGIADTIRIRIGNQSDGTYPLTVSITDSADNQVLQNTNLSLDSTAPTGTRASLDSVVSEDIYFKWGSGIDAGSGLSGRYRIQMRTNGGAWQTLFSDTTATSAVFNAQHGNSYSFEAASFDNVGNLETFLNTPDFTVQIDTTSDVNAPGAPIQLRAGGRLLASPWQASPQFTITWQNPTDPSGIAQAFYKLGTPPSSNTDFVESVSADAGLEVTVTQQNGVNLYLWLSDNAGNRDFQNFSSVMLRYDATAPTGTVASSPDTSSSETFTVSWGGTGSDGSGSGLSGLYDVRVQVDGSSFANWLTSFSGTSSSFEGQQGRTYGFEVAARDSVGNIEAFSGNAETTTFVDTLGFDNAPPGPPSGIAANGGSPRSPWQNISQFAVAWNPPTDPSGIAYALYKIGDPPVANFDTTGTVRNGNSVIVSATREGGQNFYLWFIDGRQNLDYRNSGMVQLRYDATAPVLEQISILNPDFPGNWFRAGSTQQAQVQVSYSENHASSLSVASSGLSFSSTLEDIDSGSDISETVVISLTNAADGAYDVNVTLSDSASNNVSSTVQIAIDNSAPTGTTASSPDTSANTTFRVSWAGSGSDGSGSGLSGRYHVRVQQNGGQWVDWLTNFSGTSENFTGENGVEYSFEAAAIDNVGNIESFRNSAETTTIIDTVFVDGTAPTVNHTPGESVDEGTDVTIQAQITDNNQVEEVTLFYRQNGVSAFQAMQMLPVSGNLFAATIPAQQVSGVGLSYYIQASDGRNITFSPASAWDTMPYNISVRIVGTDSRGIVKSEPQPGGGEATAYRMISIPLNLEQSGAIDVLQDDLGTYDPMVWRLFQYVTENDTYVEYPDVIDFSPGKALWLIVKDSDIQLDSGVGTSVPANEPFEITLSQGWNDIGNPFQFNVDVSNVVVTSGNISSVQGPYTYEGQWLLPNQVTQLAPWEGYSFFSETDNVTIAINPVAAANSQAAKKLNRSFDFDWAVGVKAYSGDLKDEFNRVGVAASASENWDALDFLEPPFLSDRVSITFPHHDWDRLPGNFKSDFQPSGREGWVWHFNAETSLKGRQIKLVFSDLKSLPSGLNAVLIDRVAVQKFDLRAMPEYEFLPDQKTLSRRFELVIGTDAYISKSENILSLLPEEFYLSQNYPNPFNAGTKLDYHIAERSKVKIEIMNILGQTITTLVEKYQEPGVYTLNWDGKDGHGLEMASGVYFAKLRAGKVQKIRKMLYIR